MKRILALWGFALMIANLVAWPIRIQSWKLDEDIKLLTSHNVSIDYVNRQTSVIIAYVRDIHEDSLIQSLGLDYIAIPDEAKEYALKLIEETKDSKDPMRAYYSLDEYHTFMLQTAAQYPSICQLIQFGTSVQGRPLYMMKISDNVTLEEYEPQLKYVSSIHGDEVVGYDMLIRLIQLLTSQYSTNPRITNIVNNTEIWINPMMNPDGYALVQRYNANGIDLNRNFPTPPDYYHPDGNAWQVETQAIMDLDYAHDFDLSMNFHGGALVINYPWDYTYTLAPDNDLLIEMSLTYSRQNLPMYNSTEFPQGITNGAAWYVITGGMQDWNYGFTDCIDLTAEIGVNKWPPSSQLDTYWEQNRESMLQYLEFAQRGIHGIVTNTSGIPINATITLAANSKLEHTDMPVGDYHRLALGGTYQVTASSFGYLSQAHVVNVPENGSVIQNFSLSPALLTTFRGQLRNLDGNPIPDASVSINTQPVTTAQADAQGLFQISSIFEGDYQITINAPNYDAYNQPFIIRQDDLRQVFILRHPIFGDDFESGMGNWTATGTWGTISYEGSMVLTDSPAGNYTNNQNRSCRLTNPVSLANITNPVLSFRCKYDLESSYDYVYVEASSNATTWTQLGSFTGAQSTWQNQFFSLSAYTGGNCYIRFRLRTDSSETADGIYIDDVQIGGINNQIPVYGDVNGDSIVNKADIQAISDYTIGMDSLPILDPRPWETFRINNADVDNSETLTTFDCHILLKYLSEPTYRLPVQSNIVETALDPGLSVNYDGTLHFNFIDPALLKSLSFSTAPNDLLEIHHNGYGTTVCQSYSPDTDSYAFAGYNITFGNLYADLEPNPTNFTVQYNLNGVPGSLYVNTGNSDDDNTSPQLANYLQPNVPNPFNPATNLYFSLAKPANTNLQIYNLKGQLVRTLLSAELVSGNHNVFWDGTNQSGLPVASGIYFARLSTPTFSQTRKMLLSK